MASCQEKPDGKPAPCCHRPWPVSAARRDAAALWLLDLTLAHDLAQREMRAARALVGFMTLGETAAEIAVSDIARAIGRSERAAQAAVAALKRRGGLLIRPHPAGFGPNVYVLQRSRRRTRER